jgi:hypothetical protein
MAKIFVDTFLYFSLSIDQKIHNILLNVLDLENEVVYIAINTQT